jgi:hypothetical protein
MRDEAIATAPHLTPAEAAVYYLLQRMRLDADLRHHLLDTEAFAKLCAAESRRTGTTAEAIEAVYSVPAPHCADERPKLVACRAAIGELLAALEHMRYCRHCAEGSWEDCNGGRDALAAIAAAEALT